MLASLGRSSQVVHLYLQSMLEDILHVSLIRTNIIFQYSQQLIPRSFAAQLLLWAKKTLFNLWEYKRSVHM